MWDEIFMKAKARHEALEAQESTGDLIRRFNALVRADEAREAQLERKKEVRRGD